MAPTREVKTALVAAAATLGAGLLVVNHSLVGVFYDDGLYAGLATALAAGHGYVHPNLPGMPAAVHYPPLYPIVLAPLFGLWSVSGAAIVAKLLNALLAAANVGLITWHAQRLELLGAGLPRWFAPVTVCAAALAIPVLATQSVLFAEPLFAMLLALTVTLSDRIDPPVPWLAGGAAALALLTRSIGISLLVGAVCYLWARRAPARMWVALVVPPLIAAVAWGAWVAAHADGIDPAIVLDYGTYGSPVSQAGLSALAVNVPDLPRPLEALAFGWISVRWVYAVFATAALGVGLYGLAILSRRSSIGFTLICYLIILALWPYPPDRFLWAVLPWLGLTWGVGAVAIWRRWSRMRMPVGVLAALALGGYAQYEIRGFAGRWWQTEARSISANFTELLPVLRSLPDSAVLATDDEPLVWLYTRRRSVPLYLERYHGRQVERPTPPEYRAYLQRMGVTHVLLASVTSPSAIELRALLTTYPSLLTPIYRWSDGRWLFAINRGP